MQKRARILDNKNMKRLHINRRGRSDINQSSSSTFFYIRMVITWITMVALDAMTGFRFELLWPTWLMVRAAAESIQMRNQHCVTTIANPTAARFSILFVCVTATSDLICYLFIPIRMLIFLATTYVWINLYCHTQGGFLRTIATLYGGERSQSWSILLITFFIVAFELFLRIRSHPILISIFPNVTEWAGVSPVWPRSLNAFFGAHSIGYPAVLITVSLHYYFNEWKLRRKQGDVSNRNEQLFRILVESLPAEYEGPKDYTTAQCIDEGGEMYYLDPPVGFQPIQSITAPPATAATATPPPTTTSRKNGSVNKAVQKKKKANGATNGLSSTPPNDKKKGKSMRGDGDQEDQDESDVEEFWGETPVYEERRGIWIVRILYDTVCWALCMLFSNNSSSSSHKPSSTSSTSSRRAQEEYDEDEIDDVSFEKKNGRTDSLTTSKSRTNTMTSTTSRSNQKQQQQQQQQKTNGKASHHQNHHQKTNGSANGHARATTVRDSSHDTNGSTNEAEIRSLSRELDSLRAELASRRSLEDDYKLQMSMHESNESRLSQQLSNMKLKVEQMEIKCSTLERHRESDKSQLEQADRKYAELLGKKTEIEATLSAERKARNESAGKKIDVAEHQRERERQLESEIDKLRADLKSKEDSNLRMEGELNGLRNYKEENDIEALHMELRLVREKSTQMEESLAGENKLKQSLFKCLGDARDTIKSLERKVAELVLKNGAAEIMTNGHATENNNENDTLLQTASDQSSPHQHSAMGSPVPSAKMPLSVNISNRGSPFNEKISPPIGIASVLTAAGPPPPDYIMAVGGGGGHPKQRYNEFTHMPTGEHRLFETMPSSFSAPSPTGSNPDDDFLMNQGKFGAVSNPTRPN